VKRKVLFIINPLSGVTRKRNIPGLIEKYIDRSAMETEVIFTSYAGHAVEITKEYVAKNFDTVVAVGGDGSVNEVARCLAGTPVTLGIIPLGSGNGLARHLRIPLHTGKAIELLNRNKRERIDACQVNKHYFFSGAGFGFVADVVHSIKRSGFRGFKGYTLHAMKNYFFYRAQKVHLEANGRVFDGAYFVVHVSNSNQFGYEMKIAPDADLQDGVMELVIASKKARWHVLGLAFDTFTNRFQRNNKIFYLHTPRVKVDFEGRMKVHVDGDAVWLDSPAVFRVLPLHLNVIVP